MKKLICLFLLSVSVSTWAAELIAVPGGVTLRALLDWEDVTGLRVAKFNETFESESIGGVSDAFLSQSDFCEGHARYSTTGGPEGWQDLSALCVRGADPSLKFVFLSDTQEFHAEHAKSAGLIDSILRRHPDLRFVLNSGDLVQRGVQSEWRRYRAISSRYTSRLPLVPVLGNHEFFGDKELAIRHRVYATPGTEKNYYSLDYDLFQLIVLDSNVDQMTAGQRKYQDDWLEAELRRASERRRQILVTYHHPTYSNGLISYLLPYPPLYTRKHWFPLFHRYGVRLILNGHDHLFQRLRVGAIPVVVAGAAGGKLGLLSPKASVHTERVIPKVRTVSLVEVTGNRNIHITTYDTATAQVIDRVSY